MTEIRFSDILSRKSLVNFSIFFILFITTNVLAFSFHDEYLFHFHSSIAKTFMERNFDDVNHTIVFNEMLKTSDWWKYAETIFVGKLNEHMRHDTNDSTYTTVWNDNIIIGMPKIRQIRVAENTCLVHRVFNRYFNNCYAPYKPELEEKTIIFKGTPYLTYNEYPVHPIKGTAATYTGPGYVQFLTYNTPKNTEILRKLKSEQWIDRGTRVVILEMIYYNLNIDTFSNVRFIAEKLPTGNFFTSYSIDMLPVYTIWTSTKLKILITSAIFYITLVLCLSKEIWSAIRKGIYPYFHNTWNLLTWVFMISSFSLFALSVVHKQKMYMVIDSINKTTDEVFLDDLIVLQKNLKMFLAISCVSLWIYIFRYVSFNETMLSFSKALRASYHDIFGFFIMFLIIFLAFASLGLLLFCKSNPAFATFKESLITMTRMTMSDFQYENLEESDHIFGPMFFIAYILFIYFIILNTFLAVISDAYVAMRQTTHISFNFINRFLMYVVRRLKRLFRRCKMKAEKRLSQIMNTTSKHTVAENNDEIATDESDETSEEYEMAEDEEEEEPTEIEALQKKSDECERVHARVQHLETKIMSLIDIMDRILQKLEDMYEERE